MKIKYIKKKELLFAIIFLMTKLICSCFFHPSPQKLNSRIDLLAIQFVFSVMQVKSEQLTFLEEFSSDFAHNQQLITPTEHGFHLQQHSTHMQFLQLLCHHRNSIWLRYTNHFSFQTSSNQFSHSNPQVREQLLLLQKKSPNNDRSTPIFNHLRA